MTQNYMLTNIPIDIILKTALSGGGDLAEIFAERTTTAAISHEDKKVERVVSGIDAGYGIRVIKDGRTSYGYTNDANELTNLAISLQASQSEAKQPPLNNCVRGIASSPKAPRNDEQSIQLVTRTAETAWSKDPKIVQVQVNFRDTDRKIWIANSEGLSVQDEKKDRIMVVVVIASSNGITQTGMEPAFGDFDPERMAFAASRRALLMLSAKHAPKGLMPVVISSSAGGTMMHEAVGHGLEADLAGQGLSVFEDKIGEQVASKIVTVIDDATMEGMRGSFRYDDEGNPAQRTILIENGILKAYLQSDITAKRMGMKPTGNGRRESYRNRPIPRMANTIVTKGKDDPEKIIASVPKGLFVRKMGGGQVNTINGDFVFEAQEAYLIENGKVGEPVRGATLIGNGPKVLMEIDMVGSDIGYGIGTCGKEGQGVPVSHGMPTIRIPSITIGGA